jgi:hypothetical protein
MVPDPPEQLDLVQLGKDLGRLAEGIDSLKDSYVKLADRVDTWPEECDERRKNCQTVIQYPLLETRVGKVEREQRDQVITKRTIWKIVGAANGVVLCLMAIVTWLIQNGFLAWGK